MKKVLFLFAYKKHRKRFSDRLNLCRVWWFLVCVYDKLCFVKNIHNARIISVRIKHPHACGFSRQLRKFVFAARSWNNTRYQRKMLNWQTKSWYIIVNVLLVTCFPFASRWNSRWKQERLRSWHNVKVDSPSRVLKFFEENIFPYFMCDGPAASAVKNLVFCLPLGAELLQSEQEEDGKQNENCQEKHFSSPPTPTVDERSVYRTDALWTFACCHGSFLLLWNQCVMIRAA